MMLEFKFERHAPVVMPGGDKHYGHLDVVYQQRITTVVDNILMEGDWQERVMNYAHAAAAGASAVNLAVSRSFTISGLPEKTLDALESEDEGGECGDERNSRNET